jgi:hypothetical protein
MDTSWLLPLDTVNSEEEGRELVWQHSADVTDADAAVLKSRAAALREAGDPDGAAEFETWSAVARSIVTKRDLLATGVRSQEECIARMRAVRERFDDAFVEMCVETATQPFGPLSQQIASGDRDAAEATVAQVQSRVEFELVFFGAIAEVSGSGAYRAQKDLAEGRWRRLLLGAETAGGAEAKTPELREQAQAALMACAANPDAPVALRSQAENEQATLAYPGIPQVTAHQTTALRLAEEAGDRELAQELRRNLAYWARQSGDWHTVFGLLQKNVSEAEKAVLHEHSPQLAGYIVRDARRDVTELVDACLELGKTEPAYWERAIETVEWGKARAQLRAAMEPVASYKPVPRRLLEREQRLRDLSADTGRKLGMLPANVAERHKAEVEWIFRLIGRTEAQIEKFAVRRALDSSCFPCSYPDMVKSVPAGAAVISYFQQEALVLIFVLGPEGLKGPPAESPVSSKDIARAVVQLQLASAMRGDFGDWDQIQRRIDEQVGAFYPTGALQYMYRVLIAPVRQYLDGCEIVYISAHDALQRIPFQAALKNDTTALIDEVAVAYAPGFALLRRALATERTNGGQPVFAAGVSKEKGGPGCSREEAEAVAQAFGASPEPATRDAVITRGMKSQVLHLSCHTDLSNAVTEVQGLLLEDGIFPVKEIVNGRCQASLVFLSACETAHADLYGDGMELAGMVGAFLRSGAPSVVATMWKMPESVSVALVRSYYTELVTNKANRAVALQRAIQAIKKQERFNHPYFWAPICLYGAA